MILEVNGIFVGYDNQSPAYLVYFSDTQTVKRVRCVQFMSSSREETKLTTDGATLSEENIFLDTKVRQELPTGAAATQPEAGIGESQVEVSEEDQGSTQTVKPNEERRYPRRERNRPQYLYDYAVDSEIDDYITNVTHTSFIHHCYRTSHIPVPETYEDAISSPESNQWKSAMDEGMSSLKVNDTYELTVLPKDRTAVGGKWIFQVKPGANGVEKFKARYVAKGYSQVKDIDYSETFAPTANLSTVRVLLNIAVERKLSVHQMDVKTAFLNAEIDHEIYVEQPEGYVERDSFGNKLYCKLKKSLYGLKQSSRMWNSLIHKFFISEGFKQSKCDPCLYMKFDDCNITIVLIWVDDLIIACSNKLLLDQCKQALYRNFRMTDLGELKWFLGISFSVTSNCIEMNQSKYIEKILDKFNMTDCYVKKVPCDPSFANTSCVESNELINASLYREIIGSLIYVMTFTRPDLCFAVTKLSQYMSKPTKAHLNAAKQVLRYLKGTIHYGICYCKSSKPLQLIGFSDSDWGSSEDRKSISGYCFSLYEHGPLISWKSKKQQTVALSSCEAEYMALTYTIQEAKFLKQLLSEFFNVRECCVSIGVDNQSAINLAKNPVIHQRSKHIDIRYHFIRDEVQKGDINLFYVSTKENVADIFTKPASQSKLELFQYIRG